jgi:hypothetical protein
MTLWSRPTASDWASLRASWNRDVSLSIRMVENLGEVVMAAAPRWSGNADIVGLFQAAPVLATSMHPGLST